MNEYWNIMLFLYLQQLTILNWISIQNLQIWISLTNFFDIQTKRWSHNRFVKYTYLHFLFISLHLKKRLIQRTHSHTCFKHTKSTHKNSKKMIKPTPMLWKWSNPIYIAVNQGGRGQKVYVVRYYIIQLKTTISWTWSKIIKININLDKSSKTTHIFNVRQSLVFFGFIVFALMHLWLNWMWIKIYSNTKLFKFFVRNQGWVDTMIDKVI